MYRGVSCAVVLPAYNVAAHLERALTTIPSFVDLIVVVDDASSDATAAVARRVCEERTRSTDTPSVLAQHERNRGVGAAISTGYDVAVQRGAAAVCVMAGDGQMDPADLPSLLDPLVEGRADYVKGNRFAHAELWRAMPKTRIFGNVVLSLLTKVSSGYPRLFDSQCGYTAISARALLALEGGFFSRYGYPNDLLARLRAAGARVVDVPVRPIYDGQSSGIRPWTILYPMLFVLARSFGRRLWVQRIGPVFGRRAPRQLPPAQGSGEAEAALLPARPR
ncbi:MAG: glycosyl transferase [Proteobacteria bacterium]|nr:MAG: glycosyl transferase [Pseudomonadota bacterium]PIE17354.1 MAG: glycosyl transferase [Pseudomonadota bacterium]